MFRLITCVSAACDDCGGEYEDDDYPGGLHWDSTAATRPPCATCRRCGSGYASDRTPMSNRGYCMLCRPHIAVTCQRCGTPCPGAFDGQETCAECRAERLGVQQYEDKQTALFAVRPASSATVSPRPPTTARPDLGSAA